MRKILFCLHWGRGIEKEPGGAESDLRGAESLTKGVEEEIRDGRGEPVWVAKGGEFGRHSELVAAATLCPIPGDEGVDDDAANARGNEVGEGNGITGEHGADRGLGGKASVGESFQGEEATGDAWGGGGQLASDLVAVGLEGQTDDDAIASATSIGRSRSMRGERVWIMSLPKGPLAAKISRSWRVRPSLASAP